jgi:hypothetical protein
MFDFRMGRGREGPLKFLSRFEGILQTDGYSVYERVGGPKLVHAACWAHARRKFFEAAKLNPDDRVAAQMIACVDELFAIDAAARNAGMDHAGRHVLRRERSQLVLDRLRNEIETLKSSVLPSSSLGKAFSYTISLWRKLVRFLEYPEIELSNNLAENSMRPVVVGRKNWIHVGGEDAGPRVAAILSIVESCRRLAIPLREYLASVLPRIANMSIQRIASCTPAVWAASDF